MCVCVGGGGGRGGGEGKGLQIDLLDRNLALNSFGAKFQTTFVVCFFILTNYRLERRLYVKLKDWMSNSVDPDVTAH